MDSSPTKHAGNVPASDAPPPPAPPPPPSPEERSNRPDSPALDTVALLQRFEHYAEGQQLQHLDELLATSLTYRMSDEDSGDENDNIDDDEEVYYNELEIASVSDMLEENPNENPDSSTSSPPSDINDEAQIQQIENSFADISTQTRASAIHGARCPHKCRLAMKSMRGGTCRLCFQPTRQSFLFCNRCFKTRRSWLPPRPKRRRKQKPLEAVLPRTRASREELTVIEGDSADNPVEDSHSTNKSASGEQGINLNEAFLVSEDPALTQVELTDSRNDSVDDLLSNTKKTESEGKLSNEGATAETADIVNNSDRDDSSDTKKDLCNVCCIKEKNSAFVHNKTAHVFSCFSCADKILKRDGRCPICRERILRVVKIVVA